MRLSHVSNGLNSRANAAFPGDVYEAAVGSTVSTARQQYQAAIER